MVPDFDTYDDGALIIYKTRAGAYEARNSQGEPLCCGLDKESVLFWGREHLNGFQNSYKTYPKKESNYKL